jgi:nucleotide sugar dehydrogenase
MKVCIVGLGYVGLTLALTLSDCGIKISGIDINKNTIKSLKEGKSTVSEKGVSVLLHKHTGKNFNVLEKINEDFDTYVICVGTPLNYENLPTLDYLIHASEKIGLNLKKNNLVIIRSTVPVGTTRDIIIPILEEKSGLKSRTDFKVVFAPERTAEGIAISELRTNPQIIGGLSNESVIEATKLFQKMTKTIVPVSSIEAAEMIKLIDNTYRDVHFAYSNEIALICEMLRLDAHECIKKANFQYSRNKVPIPSPGVGGPCLSKDSYILSYVTKQFEYKPDLIMHSRLLNEQMPSYLAKKIIKKIESLSKDKNKIKIFIIGFAFKGEPETADIRKSPTLILISELKKYFSTIYGYDPIVPLKELDDLEILSSTIENGFENSDCVIFMNNHKSYLTLDLKQLLNKTSKPCIFVDCWGMFRDILKEDGIIYTGVGVE